MVPSTRRGRPQWNDRTRKAAILLLFTLYIILLEYDAAVALSLHPVHSQRQRPHKRTDVILRTTRKSGGDHDDRSNNNNNRQSRHESFLDALSSDQPKSHFFSQKSIDQAFNEQDTASAFSQLCSKAHITRPSKIQAMAWPVIAQGKHAIIADQTGSGKTLSYLLPLLYRLQQAERLPNTAAATTAVHPRLLILAPTAELADQIHQVCWTVLPNKNACGVLTATGNYQTAIRDQIRYLQSQRRLDVLVSTPGRIATILRTRQCATKTLNLSHLQAVVWDEVDFLLREKTFGPQLATVGAAAATSAQCIFVTATLPDSVVSDVRTQFPGAALVKGPGLHKVAPSVTEKLVDVSTSDPSAGDSAKATALVSALRQNRCRRTLIFGNTVSACRTVVNLLERHDRRGAVYHTAAFHNAIAPAARTAALEQFRQAADDQLSYILVCTDRAARGVDFAVDHVVIYDFPSDPADYVRRVGRTARAGRGGQCTVLAYGWQLPIARTVMRNQQRGATTGRRHHTVFSIAKDSKEMAYGDGEDEEGEYWVGKKKFVGGKDKLLGTNIASGRLWTDRK